MDKPIANLRREYALTRLDEVHADPDPLREFDAWFDAAVRSCPIEPNAMCVATVDAQGQPSVRMMLLKGYDARGFVFYSNYESRKARELEGNPRAALCFWWPELERQVRIEGRVARISAEESRAYFATRPRSSQLGAIASPQSQVIANREVVEQKLAAVESEFAGRDLACPHYWGGYRLTPDSIEFWQGRERRLHDRLMYRRDTRGSWTIQRLAP